MTIMSGTKLGRYEIRSQVGAGGMGEVYLAEDTVLHRKVAVKFLSSDAAQDRELLGRFEQEAFTASALNHPNILTVFEIGEADSMRFIATEYVDGETLRRRMKHSRLHVRESLDIAIQVASALAAAHKAGVIHRDIKPENLMVRHDDSIVKVLDFGLAKPSERLSVQLIGDDLEAATRAMVNTSPGVVMGTAAYMSPEQARGLAVDERTDIWSLGVVLYEMVAGRLPFAGQTSSDVISMILQKDPPALTRLSDEATERLDEIVTKALAKDREERYQGAKDLLIDLRRLKQHLDFESEVERTLAPESRSTTEAMRPSDSVPSATRTASADVQTAASSAEDIVTEIKRHKKGIAIMAAAVLVLFLAVAGYFFYMHHSPALTDKDTILLADFVNTTGDAVFDSTLKQALAVQLGQSPFLNIFSDDHVRDALRFMGRSPDERVTRDVAREICQRQGLKALMAGSISSLGNHYVVTLEAVNAQTGDSIAREQAEADSKEQVLASLGKATSTLREKLGESLASIRKFDTPIEQVTTPSLEALQAFSLGIESLKAGKNLEGIPFFRRAIELDENFASAYVALDTAYYNTEQFDLATQAAEKAFALKDRVSEHERFAISCAYYEDATGELDKTIETYELWKRTYPRDARPANDLGDVYRGSGQYEKSVEETQEALRRDPRVAVYYSNLAGAFRALNRLEEAKATIQQGMAQKLDTNRFHHVLYSIAFLQSDAATMQQQIDWANGNSDEIWMLVAQADTAAYRGQLRKANELYSRAIGLALSRHRTENAAQMMLTKVNTETLFDGCNHAKEGVAKALAIARIRTILTGASTILAQCSDAAQAQSLIEELSTRFPKHTLLNTVFLPMARALIELNRNNPAQAIQFLQPATQYELGYIAELAPAYIRGLAYVHQQAGAEAMAEFQKILDHRTIVAPSSNSPFYPLALVGRARSAVLMGNTAKARKAYQDFFALWKDADPDIPILIEARKEYEKLK
jgi:serine/threonine protein kinase/tetratricopeptide (TPR) repeat protein